VTALYSVAALLCALALGILLWPLLRQRRITGQWSALGVAVAFAIVPVAFAVYVYVSNWDPEVQQRASEGQRLVQELAARLEQSPDDVMGWELLFRILEQHRKGAVAPLAEADIRAVEDAGNEE